MPLVVRQMILLAVLVASTSGVAGGQTICDQLLPLGVAPPAGGFSFGCAYRYVLKRSPSSGLAGTYLPLDLPACANGPCAGLTLPQKFICEATNGYACCISASDSIPIVVGNYAGPVRAGLDQRMANDTDTRPDICYSDYLGNGSRVVHVPLIHPVGNGVARVQIAGFIRMFFTRPVAGNSDILVEFVAEPTPVEDVSWGQTKIRYR